MTRQDKSIAYNIAVEIVPKIASTIEDNPLLIINDVAKWVMEHQGVKGQPDSMERNYFSAAALKSATDMAYFNNIFIYNEDKQFEKVKVEDTTLEIILNQATIIYDSLISKMED